MMFKIYLYVFYRLELFMNLFYNFGIKKEKGERNETKISRTKATL